MPVNWQDGVTWVNAANLEIMEADTAAKQAQSEKAQANGYAPLDGTAKVPLVHLPPVSGVDYIGTWGSGIAYKRGDVVRYGSNDYLAVNDSTGVTPPAAASIPLGGVSIGTSLPAAPFDGQEFVLTDSLTAPTYNWRFRYTASITGAYKWLFIGGIPAALTEGGLVQVGSGMGPMGPVFSIPRPGGYIVDFQTFFYASVIPAYLTISIVGPYPPGTAMITGTYNDRLAVAGAAEMTQLRTALIVPSAMQICGGLMWNENVIQSLSRSLFVTPMWVS